MFSSFDHVIHGGPKYTIFINVCSLKVHFQIVDISHRFGEMGKKKSENCEIWANFDPRKFFWGHDPQTFETSFGYSFSGTIARKILDHTP